MVSQNPVDTPLISRKVWTNEKTLIVPELMDNSASGPLVGQPDLEQPLIGQSTLEQPLIGQATLKQPLIGRHPLEQPLIGQHPLEHPLIGQSTLEQPLIGQATLKQPLIGQLHEGPVNQASDTKINFNVSNLTTRTRF